MAIINNPIIIIDDDEDDLELIAEAYSKMGEKNKLITFSTADSFLSYIYTTDLSPFFILCDINIPKINGLQLRDKLINDPEVKFKSIPFLIWSTSSNEAHVRIAYNKLIQGYFVKPSSYDEIAKALSAIINYWQISQHPKE